MMQLIKKNLQKYLAVLLALLTMIGSLSFPIGDIQAAAAEGLEDAKGNDGSGAIQSAPVTVPSPASITCGNAIIVFTETELRDAAADPAIDIIYLGHHAGGDRPGVLAEALSILLGEDKSFYKMTPLDAPVNGGAGW